MRVPVPPAPPPSSRRARRARAEWDSEAAMLTAFAEEARALGFRVVPECCGHDLLLVATAEAEGLLRRAHRHRGVSVEAGDVIAVEGKLRPSLTLLRQSLPPHRRPGSRGPAADFYAVVVPYYEPDFAEVCAALDVCLLTMVPAVGWRRAELDRFEAPEGARVVGYPPLEVTDLDVDLVPGRPSPRSLSPWKIAAVRICLAGLKRELTEEDFVGGPVRRRTFLDRNWMTLVRREGRAGVYALADRRTRPDLAYPEIADAILRRGG